MRFLALFALLALGCQRPPAATTLSGATTSSARRPPAESVELPNWGHYVRASVQLLALGNEPDWSLEISADKQTLRFRTVTGDSLRARAPQPIQDPDGTFRYVVPTDAGTLTATFRPDSCRSSLSGQLFDYRATVSTGGKTYTGCGISLGRLALLNDIWVLETYRGQAVTAGMFGPKVPQLEFHVADERVAGTSGCNRLTGRVRTDGTRLQFGALVGTRMACTTPATLGEAVFLRSLEQTTTYRIADNRLTLLRNGQPELVFRKVD